MNTQDWSYDIIFEFEFHCLNLFAIDFVDYCNGDHKTILYTKPQFHLKYDGCNIMILT